MLLSSKTKKYAASASFDPMGKKGSEFPDSVIKSFIGQVRKIPPSAFADIEDPRSITDPPLDLDASRKLAADAVKQYDLGLGTRIENILNNHLRACRESEVPAEKQTKQQQYVPKDPEGTPPEKRNPEAGTVQYDFLNDGIDDAVMLGHEAGHGVADDNIRGSTNGGQPRSDKDQFGHMGETQAYFVQNIVYDNLKHSSDPKVAAAAQRHFAATMKENMFDLSLADLAHEARDAINEGRPFDAKQKFDARFGHAWEKDRWAPGVFQAITKAQNATTDSDREAAMAEVNKQADRVHGRAVSILSALALYKKTQENPALKQRVTDAVLAKNGPQNIVSVLSEAGITDSAKLNKAARETINSIISNGREETKPAPTTALQPAVS